MQGDVDHDDLIIDAMQYTRWKQIKSVLKLNCNLSTPKRGTENYNPCAKYDYIFKCMCSNMNFITKKADDDACVDETTWSFSGMGGEASGQIKNKPGVTKGGQTVMIHDVRRRYPRAYFHRHALVKKIDGFTQQGPNELYELLQQVSKLTRDTPTISTNNDATPPATKIYERGRFHVTADNHFSGDAIARYCGEQGYGLTCTTRRDRTPKSIDKKYLNLAKQQDHFGKRCKAARYEKPIIAVKRVEATETTKSYTHILTSFQSTGTTNITCVNALEENSRFFTKRERGRGDEKRVWAIENNHPRQLYLTTYSQIDTVDHLLKHCYIFFLSWKYWHSPMRHAFALVIIAAYEMYNECADGLLDADWKVEVKDRPNF